MNSIGLRDALALFVVTLAMPVAMGQVGNETTKEASLPRPNFFCMMTVPVRTRIVTQASYHVIQGHPVKKPLKPWWTEQSHTEFKPLPGPAPGTGPFSVWEFHGETSLAELSFYPPRRDATGKLLP